MQSVIREWLREKGVDEAKITSMLGQGGCCENKSKENGFSINP